MGWNTDYGTQLDTLSDSGDILQPQRYLSIYAEYNEQQPMPTSVDRFGAPSFCDPTDRSKAELARRSIKDGLD